MPRRSPALVHPVLAPIALVIALALPVGVAVGAPCWQPPTEAPVTDPYREPTCRWCPGNRGIEYGTRRGDAIAAVSTGRVSYAGSIAGTVYVVVTLADGRRVTYGNLIAESYDVDELVVRGASVGRAAGRFHLGLRDGDTYVDPTPLIGRLVRRARLIPTDGTPANAAPPPRLSCAG